ncbi:glycine--tRNA ligase [Actinomadura xylanilytica]|uniref:glycine--tRNA ligase n=1 Tax=Actinomadura xylanilytica TaxID=887459 RepID=UPI00255AA9B5|nr:glycine--tRNA ligase [Actinomadura xylanilytica]MDL4771043.1 glycine--tRNA ligase [Actinomadura xylanilytica]
MQDALIRLTGFWAGHGCLVAQPMNTEVGAGTLNPSTALRVLGPEPWRVAYAEPSVRPDDARYGDNPNRLQTHTQFQVILKPEPGDAQELYLGSLAALGVDLRAHDVRFVEDDWASPALGAWGLGWEVWLDGLEITQFTYFQQSGGLTLDPVSVEITYGMERIMMALQGVAHFKDIQYAPGVTYGEAFGQAEYEMSRFYLDDADIGTARELFEAYAGEARRLIDARLPVPAHTHVLKCSHAFNVLDSRGAIGTTERARAFARMRGLAHEVAELWVERRAELEHPLGDASARPAEAAAPAAPPEITAPGTFALEIGVEELPPHEVARTADEVAGRVRRALEETGLYTGASGTAVYATPRRVIVVVTGVEPREPDTEQVVKGPRVAAAYDGEGAPTKALLGFARGHGIDPAGVGTVTVAGGEYAGYVRKVTGRPAAEVLAAVLPAIVTGLRAGKNMRWNAPGLSFARPIRWLVALLDEHEVPFTVAGMTAGRTTRVHRTADEPLVPVPAAADLVATLRAHGVEPSAERRREGVAQAAGPLARLAGGTVDFAGERALVEEIVDLVELPVAILGSFDGRYLELPEEILTTVMRKHQRYLPVRDEGGRLLPHFVTVANGECDRDAVRAGNEAVLRARYEDAAFFFQQDLRSTPEEIGRGLGKLTFTDRLGSMADRAGRIRAIAAELAGRTGLTGADAAVVRRAGELAKFDLASSMVIELSSLAGTMAREYARRAGEDEAVARALYEMELPRSAGDAPPSGVPGSLLAVADRLDLLAGLFAVGSAPTGSSDPFGLRRAALGLTAILRAQPRLAAVTVGDGLAIAARHQPVEVTPDALADAERFVARRLEQALLDEGHPVHVVRAVLPHAGTPAHAERAAADLGELLGEARFQRLATALQRVLRIVPGGTAPAYEPARFEEPAERALHEAFIRVRDELPERPALPGFTAAALALAAPIDTYFDEVMVMAEDPALRANRLGLLAAVRDLVGGVIDWRELP